MATTRFSQRKSLLTIANVFATLFVGFGLNACLRPLPALEFFEFQDMAAASPRAFVDGMSLVYGSRDVFIGLAIYAATFFGEGKSAGAILVAASGVVLVDGWVCKAFVGTAEWNHWGYAPLLTVLGGLLLGAADGR